MGNHHDVKNKVMDPCAGFIVSRAAKATCLKLSDFKQALN